MRRVLVFPALVFLALVPVAIFAQDSGEDMGMGGGMDTGMDGGMDGAKVEFAKHVLPVLQDRCFECHSDAKKKPKGRLRLDSKSWIELGGKNGPVLVAGKPERSPIYRRCALPEDHDDVMPPDGESIEKKELVLIKQWIAAGASFGAWTGEGGEAKPTV